MMTSLTACNIAYYDPCLVFPEIIDLPEKDKETLKKYPVSKEWLLSIKNYKDIRKTKCAQ